MGGDGLVTAADADGAGVVFALADIDVAGVGFGRDGVASEAVGRGGRDVAVVGGQLSGGKGRAFEVDIPV